MGTEHILWKFKLSGIILPDITGIGSFKYKDIRVSCAIFLGIYFVILLDSTPFMEYSQWVNGSRRVS